MHRSTFCPTAASTRKATTSRSETRPYMYRRTCTGERCACRGAARTEKNHLVAAAFLPFGLVATFFLGEVLAVLAGLAAGFFAELTFFFGLLFFGLLTAAGLLAFVLVVFLTGLFVAFLTPETSSQMFSVNGVSEAAQSSQSRSIGCYYIIATCSRVTGCSTRWHAVPSSKA